MAVNAKFQADFSSFSNAVEKAEVQLRGFESDAGRVEKALSRMTDNFSGRKIIQDATLMAEAVDRVGGAAKLTEDELQRVARQAAEAAAKLQAMGQAVPTKIAALAGELKESSTALKTFSGDAGIAGKAMSFLGGTIGSVAAGFTLANVIQQATSALIGLGKQAIENAGHLVDLSTKTGVSVEQLERFQFVGQQAGVSVDDFSNAVFKLGVNIAGGSSSVVSGVQALGLSYKNLKSQSPEDQFNDIVAALERMEDPQERNRIGVELFGKSFASIAAAVNDGYTEMAKQAQVSTDAQIRAIDNASDAWDRFVARQKATLASWIGNLLVAREQLDKLNPEQNQKFLALQKGGGDAEGFLLQLAEIDAAAKKGDASYKKYVQTVLAGNAVIIDADAALARWDFDTKHKAEIDHEAAAAAEKLAAANQRFRDSVVSLTSSAVGAAKGFGAYGALLPDLSGRTSRFREQLEELASTTNEFHQGITVAGDEIETVTIPAFAALPNVTARFTKELTAAHDAAAKSTSVFGALGDKLGSLLKGFTGGKGLGGVFENIGKGAIDQVGRALTGGLQSLVSLGLKGIGSLFGKLFGNPEKEINPIRQAFVDAAGGLDALNKHAHEAGVTLDALLNAKNAKQYQAAIDDLGKSFDRLAGAKDAVTSGLSGAATGSNAFAASLLDPLRSLQDAFDKAVADAGKSSTALGKLLIKDPSKKDAEAAKYGLSLADQIYDAMKEALGDEEHIGDLNTALAKTIGDVQPSFEHLGQFVAATFAAQIHEGASAFDAFQSLAPSFQALQDGVEQFGLQSTKTIDSLLKVQGVVGVNKDLFDSIQAVTQIYDGLTEAGYITKDLFESFGSDLAHQFDLLVRGGADSTTALQLMQPELQKLWEGQEKFGAVTDEATAKLLAQAEQQGLVGEDMKDVNEKILDVLIKIAEVFGAELPKSLNALADSAKDTTDKVQEYLDGLRAPDLHPTIDYSVNLPDVPIERMASGGMGRVTKPTLFLAGEAGSEDFAFSGGGKSFGSGDGGNDETPHLLRQLLSAIDIMPIQLAAAVAKAS